MIFIYDYRQLYIDTTHFVDELLYYISSTYNKNVDIKFSAHDALLE